MKNEILARAITEIDDDLLAEAREPVKKKKPNYRIMITKYAAAVAACFVLVFSFVFFGNYGRSGELDISIDGQSIVAGEDDILLPRISVHTTEQTPRYEKDDGSDGDKSRRKNRFGHSIFRRSNTHRKR